MFTKLQRPPHHPYIQRFPWVSSRLLLSGNCRSFAGATRAIWEGYRTLVMEAEQTDSLNAPAPLTLLLNMLDGWDPF